MMPDIQQSGEMKSHLRQPRAVQLSQLLVRLRGAKLTRVKANSR
jgi:hypothetical protein